MSNHKKSPVITENIFDSLKVRCAQAGTNLTEVCKRAGVDRSSLERWKRKEPKTITIIRKIETEIEKIEAKKKA